MALERDHSIKKLAKVEEVKKVKENAISKRNKVKHKHTLSVQNNYYNKYLNDEEKADKNKETLSKLEQVEQKLMLKVQATVDKQYGMYKTLEKLVKFGKIDK